MVPLLKEAEPLTTLTLTGNPESDEALTVNGASR